MTTYADLQTACEELVAACRQVIADYETGMDGRLYPDTLERLRAAIARGEKPAPKSDRLRSEIAAAKAELLEARKAAGL